MPETPQEPRHKFSALTTLAAVLATFLLAAAAYVCWQAAHILFPQNVYETALPITISDTIEADGVLLFDEPLSNLDAKLRVQLRNELKKMQREFGITTIYVTHDQEEALTLSDRIAVFNKGYIEQIGTPNEIYNHSKTEFVCNFIGDINRVEAPIAAKMKLAAGQNHFIRLERLHVNKPKRDDEILIDGVVENIEYYGLYIKYYIDVGSQILKAIEKNDGINIYAPGEKVTVAMKPTDVMSYDAQ